MHSIETIEPVALVTTGRTGSDLLQSLFDSHSQVLTFNGHLVQYYSFWENNLDIINSEKFRSEDLIYKFISHHLELLKSHYDLAERKNTMGDNFDESISIDLPKFIKITSNFLQDKKLNSKNFLLAVHVAYAICLGQDISRKSIFLFHIHNADLLPSFLKDFPDTRIICMTRDPRANYYSGIYHRILAYKANTNRSIPNCTKLFIYLLRIFEDAYSLDKYNNNYTVLKLEELGDKCLLTKVCTWLDIKYESTLELSTFGGIRWRGDALSVKTNNEKGFSSDMISNKWEGSFGNVEKYVFNFILNSRLEYYLYPYKRISMKDYFIVPFLILLPLRLEIDIFKLNLSKKQSFRSKMHTSKINIIGYFKRVILFFKYYKLQISGNHFKRNTLTCLNK
jgi:hypothetical protein